MHYTRPEKKPLSLEENSTHKQKIEASDYHEITKIRSILKEKGTIEVADIMDFSINNFGSTTLKEMYKSRRLPFKREYWKVGEGNSEHLCILTLIPEGQNPGRFLDSIYLFPLGEDLLSEKNWELIISQVIELASSKGYSTHAIRRIVPEGTPAMKSEVATLTAFALHPKAWSFYERLIEK